MLPMVIWAKKGCPSARPDQSLPSKRDGAVLKLKSVLDE